MATTKTTMTSKTATKAQVSKAQYPITRYKNPDIKTAFSGRAEITPDGAGFRVTFIDRHGEQNERIATLTKALSYVEQCGFTLEAPAPKKSAKSSEKASPEAVKAMMEQASAALTGALDDDSSRVCERHGSVYTVSCPECDVEFAALAEQGAAQAHATFSEIKALQDAQAELDQAVELRVAEIQSTPPVEVAEPVEAATPVATPEKPAKSVKPAKAEKPATPAETVEAYQVAPAQREIEQVASAIREALGKKYARELNALIAESPEGYAGLRRHVAILSDIYGAQKLDSEIRDVAAALVTFLDSGNVSEALKSYLLRYRLENIINLCAETYLSVKAHGVSIQTILEGYTLTLSTRTLADGSHYFERDYHRAR